MGNLTGMTGEFVYPKVSNVKNLSNIISATTITFPDLQKASRYIIVGWPQSIKPFATYKELLVFNHITSQWEHQCWGEGAFFQTYGEAWDNVQYRLLGSNR